jgi:hypothetical protein
LATGTASILSVTLFITFLLREVSWIEAAIIAYLTVTEVFIYAISKQPDETPPRWAGRGCGG